MSLVSEELRRNLDATIFRILRLQAVFRCATCTLAFQPNMCCDCMVDTHARHPFHELLEWDDDIELFTRTTLRDMGLRVGFGHSGATCPRPRPGRLEALTINGVFQVSVDYCTCPGAPGRAEQIKAHGWWPMWSNFCSALPHDVLDQYCDMGENDAGED
ncbi:hypothetical protein GGX14DRAFT_573202 [Mycena pura]|uniref:CxC2-like cysteine cluster KDZ transposase-associated domain-containing protein n=1 Tax=Mycena pura TaxID=153505 RepID=A0AAD6UZF8_9AGAR|nr:hypothetical protein GGX14DRAFT_573164 [Mycena pura]KAJ7198759.1 hypothetical protein GGX14DRAFT_573202 [Mycena pura]